MMPEPKTETLLDGTVVPAARMAALLEQLDFLSVEQLFDAAEVARDPKEDFFSLETAEALAGYGIVGPGPDFTMDATTAAIIRNATTLIGGGVHLQDPVADPHDDEDDPS